jgi:hypothetical protein
MVQLPPLCHYQALVMETHHGNRWPQFPGKPSQEFATSIRTSFTPVRAEADLIVAAHMNPLM